MTQGKSHGKHSAWRIILLVVVLPLFCLVAGTGLWWSLRNSASRQTLDARKDEFVIAGFPVDDVTMESFYKRISDVQDDGRWEPVLSRWASREFGERSRQLPIIGLGEDIPKLDAPWQDQAAVMKLLEEERDYLQTLHELASQDASVAFARKWESINTLLPNVQNMRQAARMLLLQYEVAARTGDQKSEFEAVNSLLGCALALRDEPILVGQLVSVVIHSMTCDALRRSLSRHTFSAPQIDELRRRFELFEQSYNERYQNTMAGERGMMLPLFDNPEDAVSDSSGALAALGSRAIDALYYLELMEQASEANLDNPTDFMTILDQLEKRLDKEFNDSSLLKKIDHLVTGMVFPALVPAGAALVRHVQQNRLALTALALERERLQNGVYPDSLDALATAGLPDTTMRPLGQDRFAYRKQDDRIELWGVSIESLRSQPPPWQIQDTPPATDNSAEAGNVDQQETTIHLWYWQLPATTSPPKSAPDEAAPDANAAQANGTDPANPITD